MEHRKEKRLPGVINITMKDGDHAYTAALVDLSKKGLSARSEHIFPTYKVIDIIIQINEKPVQLKGCVRWVNENLRGEENLSEIGILLINPPREYLDYIDTLCS